jgi:hypothetical protein
MRLITSLRARTDARHFERVRLGVGERIDAEGGGSGSGSVRMACALTPPLDGTAERRDADDKLSDSLSYEATQPSRLGAFEVYLVSVDVDGTHMHACQ